MACTSRGDAPSDAAEPPSRAGDVWEVASVADRESAPAALAAFVTGTHVMVLDGDDAYPGMRETKARKGADGARVLALADGDTARLAVAGDSLELRLSTGERIALHRRAEESR